MAATLGVLAENFVLAVITDAVGMVLIALKTIARGAERNPAGCDLIPLCVMMLSTTHRCVTLLLIAVLMSASKHEQQQQRDRWAHRSEMHDHGDSELGAADRRMVHSDVPSSSSTVGVSVHREVQ